MPVFDLYCLQYKLNRFARIESIEADTEEEALDRHFIEHTADCHGMQRWAVVPIESRGSFTIFDCYPTEDGHKIRPTHYFVHDYDDAR